MIDQPPLVDGDVRTTIVASQGSVHSAKRFNLVQHGLAVGSNRERANGTSNDIGHHLVNQTMRLAGDGLVAAVDRVRKVPRR